ncbi:MAG: hypothetical protein ACLFNI_04515 [Natronomonas sp.]
MKPITIGSWLLVTVAIVGLAFVVPIAGAHDEDLSASNQSVVTDGPVDANSTELADWMETQMIVHMGPDAPDWMESQMGVTIDEMAQDMSDGQYHRGLDDRSGYHRGGFNGSGGTYSGSGMTAQAYGC